MTCWKSQNHYNLVAKVVKCKQQSPIIAQCEEEPFIRKSFMNKTYTRSLMKFSILTIPVFALIYSYNCMIMFTMILEFSDFFIDLLLCRHTVSSPQLNFHIRFLLLFGQFNNSIQVDILKNLQVLDISDNRYLTNYGNLHCTF